MARKQYGVFTRDGVARRIAYSPAEAVQLEYDGWSRIADAVGKLPDRATATAGKDAAEDAAPKTARTGTAAK